MVSGNTITGTFGTNLAAFDQFLGVRYWNAMGNQMRLMQGSNPTTIAHKATYNYYLNPGNNYALSMSNQSVLINTGGTATAGMFDYHAANNYQLTTFDADHDVYSANCSNSYGNTAWWYGACWSGSFWGGGDSGGYTNNPYWTSSGGEYFSWGGIWVRDPARIPLLVKTNETAIKAEGTGSMKVQIGAPKVDTNTVGLWHMEETSRGSDNTIGSQSNPGTSCSNILGYRGTAGDGLYYINPLGVTPFQVYCDMTTDGGGWTLVP